MPKVQINYKDCINCKLCISICPMGVYKNEGEKVNVIAEQDCIACRGCESICSINAITISE